MTNEAKALFLEHAISEMPREACGLIVIRKGREHLVLCRNKSIFSNQFILDPSDFASASLEGEVVAVVHSHVYTSAMPSEADKVACEATGIEWFICSVPTGGWNSFLPSGFKAPLIGRTWAHGILDCYSLVRDYYKQVLNVELMDFDREREWWDKGLDLYCDQNFKKAGFVDVAMDDLKKHDGLVMQIKSKVANHAGVYLGDDQFLHHLNRRLSSRDVYAGYYRKHTLRVVRYLGT